MAKRSPKIQKGAAPEPPEARAGIVQGAPERPREGQHSGPGGAAPYKRSRAGRRRPGWRRGECFPWLSAEALEAELGLEEVLVRRLRQAGASGFPRKGGVEAGELLAWLARDWWGRASGTPAGQQELDLATGDAQRELQLWKAKRERLKFLAETEQVVGRDEVRSGLGLGMAKLFTALDQVLAGDMPPVLVGLREMEIRARVVEEIERCKEVFKAGLTGLAGAEKVPGGQHSGNEEGSRLETETKGNRKERKGGKHCYKDATSMLQAPEAPARSDAGAEVE